MLQIDIDAAQEHALGPGRRFAFGEERQVQRNHRHIVIEFYESVGKGVLTQAVAAVEVTRAGCEHRDAHQESHLRAIGSAMTTVRFGALKDNALGISRILMRLKEEIRQ